MHRLIPNKMHHSWVKRTNCLIIMIKTSINNWFYHKNCDKYYTFWIRSFRGLINIFLGFIHLSIQATLSWEEKDLPETASHPIVFYFLTEWYTSLTSLNDSQLVKLNNPNNHLLEKLRVISLFIYLLVRLC